MSSLSGPYRIVTNDWRFDKLSLSLELGEHLRRRFGGYARSGAEPEAAPGYRDLASVMTFVRAIYRPHMPLSFEYQKVPANNPPAALRFGGGTTLEFTLQPNLGHFTTDMVLHLRLAAVGDAAGTQFYRYCAYPGLRIVERAKFTSDSKIDEYTRDDAVFINDSEVRPDLRAAWDRAHGQQLTKTASADNTNGFTAQFAYADGPQTLKSQQPALDLWIPLQFSFCRDDGQALVVPRGSRSQRTVTVDLAPMSLIVQQFDADRVLTATTLANVGLTAAELYVNYVFSLPEVHQVFEVNDRDADERLVRLHQAQRATVVNPSGNFLLNAFRFPVEFFYFGVRALANADSFDQWHLFGYAAARGNADALAFPVAQWNGVAQVLGVVSATQTAGALEPALSTAEVRGSDLVQYPRLDASFYSTALQLRAPASGGNGRLTSPADGNVGLVSFSLYPGENYPSGEFQASVERDFRFIYELTAAAAAALRDGSQTFEIVFSARVLNYLQRSGDAITLTMPV